VTYVFYVANCRLLVYRILSCYPVEDIYSGLSGAGSLQEIRSDRRFPAV
jgi:hypothetical protein